MVSPLKKNRKLSQTDSTHSDTLEVTLKDNPLYIQGYNVFDKQYKENCTHNQICDTIRGSLEGISDPSSTNIIFQIGKLMSVVQSKSIFLPVETESILDYDFNKVKFVPSVSPKFLDSLYLNVFANRSNNYKVVPDLDYLEVELIYHSKTSKSESKKSEGFYHSKIYRIPYNFDEVLNFDELKSYIYNYLDSVIVYRPQSLYHFKVQTNSMFIVKEESDELKGSASKVLFRHLRTYHTSKNKDIKFIKFNLEVIDQWDIPTNDELLNLPITEMINAFYESFISSNSSKSYSFLDVDTSEESKVKIIQLSTDSSKIGDTSQLYRQYRKMLDSKPNRFDYLISVLESNTRMLLDLFDSKSDFIDVEDFYPNMFGGTSEFAQIHYDTRKVVRQQESSIETLRKYNNLVKRVMIAVFIKQNSLVLDLACGHAQDLDKYNTKRIRKLLGIDISLREINEARRRYLQRKKTLSFNAEFHHGNILDPKVFSMYIRNTKFDVVSIQLAIHYILENETSSSFILEQIHNSLNDGGLFIGSTVCCVQLSRELALNPPVQSQEDSSKSYFYKKYIGITWEFGNPIFKITMDQKSIETIKGDHKSLQDLDFNKINDIFNSKWGFKYHFFLMESIDESEYVVPWKAFVELCNKVGFRLVESLTFPEYLEKSKTLFEEKKLNLPPNVYDNLDKHFKSISNFQFSNDQERVFSLYKVFVFEKITRRDKLYIQGVKIKK